MYSDYPLKTGKYSEKVYDCEDDYPNNIHKVPIKGCEINIQIFLRGDTPFLNDNNSKDSNHIMPSVTCAP